MICAKKAKRQDKLLIFDIQIWYVSLFISQIWFPVSGRGSDELQVKNSIFHYTLGPNDWLFGDFLQGFEY